jgi:hypothetical protein
MDTGGLQRVPSSHHPGEHFSARQAAAQVSRPWYAGSMCGWRNRQCIDIWPSGITFMLPLLHFFVQKCLNIANDEVMQSCAHTHTPSAAEYADVRRKH